MRRRGKKWGNGRGLTRKRENSMMPVYFAAGGGAPRGMGERAMARRFPLYIDLTGRRVLVYGGGAVAARRVSALALFGPEITVVAPEIAPAIRALPEVRRVEDVFEPEAMPAADLVLAATNDPAVNREIVALCRQRGVLVNDASDQSLCDFHFPAVAVRGDVVVGVNAGGGDHGLVKRLAAAIRELLERGI